MGGVARYRSLPAMIRGMGRGAKIGRPGLGVLAVPVASLCLGFVALTALSVSSFAQTSGGTTYAQTPSGGYVATPSPYVATATTPGGYATTPGGYYPQTPQYPQAPQYPQTPSAYPATPGAYAPTPSGYAATPSGYATSPSA